MTALKGLALPVPHTYALQKNVRSRTGKRVVYSSEEHGRAEVCISTLDRRLPGDSLVLSGIALRGLKQLGLAVVEGEGRLLGLGQGRRRLARLARRRDWHLEKWGLACALWLDLAFVIEADNKAIDIISGQLLLFSERGTEHN